VMVVEPRNQRVAAPVDDEIARVRSDLTTDRRHQIALDPHVPPDPVDLGVADDEAWAVCIHRIHQPGRPVADRSKDLGEGDLLDRSSRCGRAPTLARTHWDAGMTDAAIAMTRRLRHWLPRGSTLPDEVWAQRHRW